VAGQPVGGAGTETALPQRGDAPHRRDLADLGPQRLGSGALLEAELAAGRRQPADGAEQPGRLGGRQVDEQALGQPRRRPLGLEPGGDQPPRPVAAQVGRDRRAAAARHGMPPGQRSFLEAQHLGQVELEQPQVAGPVEAEGAGVQPGGQQDDLAAAAGGRGGEVLVVEAGADHALEVQQRAERADRPPAGMLNPGMLNQGRLWRRVDERPGQRVVEQLVGAPALVGADARHADRRHGQPGQRFRCRHRPPPPALSPSRGTARCAGRHT
jgi:hypothetical protein